MNKLKLKKKIFGTFEYYIGILSITIHYRFYNNISNIKQLQLQGFEFIIEKISISLKSNCYNMRMNTNHKKKIKIK